MINLAFCVVHVFLSLLSFWNKYNYVIYIRIIQLFVKFIGTCPVSEHLRIDSYNVVFSIFSSIF